MPHLHASSMLPGMVPPPLPWATIPHRNSLQLRPSAKLQMGQLSPWSPPVLCVSASKRWAGLEQDSRNWECGQWDATCQAEILGNSWDFLQSMRVLLLFYGIFIPGIPPTGGGQAHGASQQRSLQGRELRAGEGPTQGMPAPGHAESCGQL